MAALTDKKSLRIEVLRRRDALPGDLRSEKDRRIRERVQGLEEYRKARTVLLYASFRSEVDTFGLISDCLAGGKVTVLPRVDREGDVLRLFVIQSLDDLAPGYLGIPEPRSSGRGEKAIEDMDFIVVPGAAFDEACNRMGYGKGYYDKLLSARRGVAAALAYEEQVMPVIPHEPHDVKMDKVITDERAIGRHG